MLSWLPTLHLTKLSIQVIDKLVHLLIVVYMFSNLVFTIRLRKGWCIAYLFLFLLINFTWMCCFFSFIKCRIAFFLSQFGLLSLISLRRNNLLKTSFCSSVVTALRTNIFIARLFFNFNVLNPLLKLITLFGFWLLFYHFWDAMLHLRPPSLSWLLRIICITLLKALRVVEFAQTKANRALNHLFIAVRSWSSKKNRPFRFSRRLLIFYRSFTFRRSSRKYAVCPFLYKLRRRIQKNFIIFFNWLLNSHSLYRAC